MNATLHNSIAAAKSRIMFGICVLFTVVILTVLGLVTAYLVSIGLHSLNWNFFRLDPIPHGMENAPGGMRNALAGTGILIALASAMGIPIGMLTGIYLAE